MLGSLQSPVIYVSRLLEASVADALLNDLSRGVPWLSVTEARKEAWMNDLDAEYTYGEGRGQRTYKPQPWNESVALLRAPMADRSRHLADTTVGIPDYAFRWDGCFLNYYANEKNALGWHSDDSPEIDHTQSIAVVSLGAERSIAFRKKGEKGPGEQITLRHGSLLLMLPGMQQTHGHKIPRHSAPCGPRVSLTYRGLRRGTS